MHSCVQRHNTTLSTTLSATRQQVAAGARKYYHLRVRACQGLPLLREAALVRPAIVVLATQVQL
jgi:hypothetical protein